ncbi:MAG TPA: carbonic anhydrase [Verrucomicrobiae bacterium]|nr:carbonic anhydrase [Verrucomicrobiae bacterium]
MESLQQLLDRNVEWSERKIAGDPQFFRRLVAQQAPEYLWIGCSDARVPANEIVDLQPGELFVHRNVANVVAPDDANAQAVIEFAVSVLKVRHIMVVGHYGCGGVQAACRGLHVGPCVDRWLEQVKSVARRHDKLLQAEKQDHRREALLCELNVLEQTLNVCGLSSVQDAWARKQSLMVHGWIYRLGDGRLRHLDFSADGPADLDEFRRQAVGSILKARGDYYATP